MADEVRSEQELRAAGDLLAAEVTYLTAFGWIPFGTIPRGNEKVAKIRWKRPNELETQLYTQEQALRLQKYLDPAFKEK